MGDFQVAGGAERDEVYSKWAVTYSDVQARLQEKPKDEKLLFLGAELLRQGHNMSVDSAGQKAIDTVESCIKNFPKSVPCHRSATYLYLSIHPKFISGAERSLSFLRKHFAPKVDEETERGYVFYYVILQKNKEGQKQIDYFLSKFPSSSHRDQFLSLRKMLDSPVRKTEK